MMRRFPPPWSIEDNGAAYVMKDGSRLTHAMRGVASPSSVTRLSPRCAGQPHIKTVIQHVIKHEPERPNDELRDNDDGKGYNPSPALKHDNSPISPIFEIIAPQGSRMPARRFPPPLKRSRPA
jgi:hypothetical protein